MSCHIGMSSAQFVVNVRVHSEALHCPRHFGRMLAAKAILLEAGLDV